MIKNQNASLLALELALPSYQRTVIAALCVLLVALIVAITLVSIEEWVSAAAEARPTGEISIIRSQRAGTVSDVFVHHGAIVARGDPIWSINSLSLVADRQDATLRMGMAEERIASTNRLIGFIESQQRWASDTAESIIGAYAAQREQLRITADSAQASYDRGRAVGVRGISIADLEELRREAERSQFALIEFQTRTLTDQLENLRSLNETASSLQSRIVALDSEIVSSLATTPLDGTVEFSRRIRSGDYLIAGEEIARVIPPDYDRLRIEISVPEDRFHRIRVGQSVRVRFRSLPFAQYRPLFARVIYVPNDATSAADGSRFFIVEASFDDTRIRSIDGQYEPLRPGLSGTARIIVGETKIWRVLFRNVFGPGRS